MRMRTHKRRINENDAGCVRECLLQISGITSHPHRTIVMLSAALVIAV